MRLKFSLSAVSLTLPPPGARLVLVPPGRSA